MAIYAIGDLHLPGHQEKPMNVFGDHWDRHFDVIRENWLSMVAPEDVVLIPGDISWAMQIEDALPDLQAIGELPGRKVILRGNHDYWWTTATKARSFFEKNDIKTIDVLHNSSFEYAGVSICGTRGWFYEESKGAEHDKKIMNREIMRLEASLKAAKTDEIYVFLHYPPKYINYTCPEILELLQKYNVKRCCYGHIHGAGCQYAFNGTLSCTDFMLVQPIMLNLSL